MLARVATPPTTPHERRSLFLSAGAFVLSACALFVSLDHNSRHGGALSIANEVSAEKALATADGYVRIQQLAIEQARASARMALRVLPILDPLMPTCRREILWVGLWAPPNLQMQQ
jgi:hypothetical protein